LSIYSSDEPLGPRGLFPASPIPPILLVLTVKGKFNPKFEPVVVPCGAGGIQLQWNAGNVIGHAVLDHPRMGIMAKIAFPKHANFAGIFFLGSRTLGAATWLTNGTPSSPISVPAGTVNDVYWLGYRPASPPGVATNPRASIVRRATTETSVTLRGGKEEKKSRSASANGVHVAWAVHGCSFGYVTPVVTEELTKDGTIIGHPWIVPCALDAGGKPVPVDDEDFAWNASHTVISASYSFLGQPVEGPGTSPPFVPETNDVHFHFAGKAKSFSWTKDGKDMKSPTLPRDTTGIDWSG
jgi:hypothetical protein